MQANAHGAFRQAGDFRYIGSVQFLHVVEHEYKPIFGGNPEDSAVELLAPFGSDKFRFWIASVRVREGL